MSVCGQTEEESSAEEGGPVRDDHAPKAASKVVRVLTVLAYLLSVSLAAILLSVYYVCVWKSPDLPKLNSSEGRLSARVADDTNYTDSATPYYDTGGSHSTVSEDAVTLTPPEPSASPGGPPAPPPARAAPAPRDLGSTDVIGPPTTINDT